MKLYIVYSKDREVKVEKVKYITVINNTLYYLVDDDPSAYIVDLNTVATFSMIE
jgi:hypothetical protein